MVETEARVYFAIKTENDLIEESIINNYIGLKPTSFVKRHANVNTPRCTIWELSTERVRNPYVSNMIDNILCALSPRMGKLKEFKKRYLEINYVLEIVIYHGDYAEGFCLNSNQLLLLSEIGASIDVDQYNYKD
jgi:hypothetical protein